MTAAVVDYYGKKKKAYFALQQAFRPIHVMMEWPLIDGEAPGTRLSKGVFVVNDYLREYPELTISWRVSDANDQTLQEQSLSSSVAENSLARVGALEWTVPADGSAPYRIRFELADSSGVLSANEYEVEVTDERTALDRGRLEDATGKGHGASGRCRPFQ